MSILSILVLLTSLGSAATLQVGKTSSYKYKTIQSAVNAAKSSDTILVADGSYPEIVKFKSDKNQKDFVTDLKIQGAKKNGKYVYPRVYGFDMSYLDAGADINGFKITKYGIINERSAPHTYRNNYFENCGIDIWGSIPSGSEIINNKFTNGTVEVGMDTWQVLVTGCTFTKSNPGVSVYTGGDANITKNTFNTCKVGVDVDYDAGASITKNTFKYCTVGIRYVDGFTPYMNYNTYTSCKTKIQKVAA